LLGCQGFGAGFATFTSEGDGGFALWHT